MPSLSVLIHAGGDAAGLARLLETLRPADEVLVVDHGHDEAVRKVSRQYGARLIPGVAGVDPGAYAVDCRSDWVLCLDPSESLSESLEASLFEWKRTEPDPLTCFSIPVREQNGSSSDLGEAETRLVNRCHVNWQGKMPPAMPTAVALKGHLLRFAEADSD